MLLHFDAPEPAALLDRARALAAEVDLDARLGVRAGRRLRLRRPGARVLRRQRRRRAAGRDAARPVPGAALLHAAWARAMFQQGQPREPCRRRCSAHRAQEAAGGAGRRLGRRAGRRPLRRRRSREQLYRILFKPDKNATEYKAVVEAARRAQRAPLDLLTRGRRDRVARTSSTGGASCTSSFRAAPALPDAAGADDRGRAAAGRRAGVLDRRLGRPPRSTTRCRCGAWGKAPWCCGIHIAAPALAHRARTRALDTRGARAAVHRLHAGPQDHDAARRRWCSASR